MTLDVLSWTAFARYVSRYGGDRSVRKLMCAEQFCVMAFAQLTYRESLRDIEVCLAAQKDKLCHMGFREPIKQDARLHHQPDDTAQSHSLCVVPQPLAARTYLFPLRSLILARFRAMASPVGVQSHQNASGASGKSSRRTPENVGLYPRFLISAMSSA